MKVKELNQGKLLTKTKKLEEAGDWWLDKWKIK